jgi:hypothetical protein
MGIDARLCKSTLHQVLWPGCKRIVNYCCQLY